MLAQMANDHDRYGDTWLMPYTEGMEGHIRGRYDEYFGQFEESGKPVPWLKWLGMPSSPKRVRIIPTGLCEGEKFKFNRCEIK
jgi:hypothetical protein